MMAAPCVALTTVPSGPPLSCPGLSSVARSREVVTCSSRPFITPTTAETGRDLTLAALGVTWSDQELPTIRVSPGDLAYLAEGADHMVVRLPGMGQVLRLRKTDVGASTNREELILRAKKDEEFFKNVARPFLSPLLTDESRLVIVEPEALMTFKKTVEARRPERRRNKEINEYGVAWICPDAASTFTDRHLPDSSYKSSVAHIRTSPGLSPRGCPSPFGEGRSILRKDLISPSKDLALDLRESQPASSTKKSSCVRREAEGATGSRVSSSRCPRKTEFRSPIVEWHERIPAKVMCVEIKPKQGYIDHSTEGLPMCVFCINQYLKPEKCRDRSAYCPQDLFSGDLTRMRRAVDSLIQTPQTNLKVFVDGEAVEDIKEYGYLRDVIISALTHDFESTNARLPETLTGGLSPRSPLGRTLAFQMLDQLGVRTANVLYRSLAEEMGSTNEADAAIHDLRCWTGDGRYCQELERQVVEQCGRCWQNGKMASFDKGDEEGGRVSEEGLSGDTEVPKAENKGYINRKISESQNRRINYIQTAKQNTEVSLSSAKSETRVIPAKLEGETGRECRQDEHEEEDTVAMTQAEKVRRLQEFLLATTAKDLSLMILLSGPHTGPAPSPSSMNVSPFSIELENQVWYLCQVTAVDLIAKPPNKIRKREKDHKKQIQVLRDLITRGEEPSCCRC